MANLIPIILKELGLEENERFKVRNEVGEILKETFFMNVKGCFVVENPKMLDIVNSLELNMEHLEKSNAQLVEENKQLQKRLKESD